MKLVQLISIFLLILIGGCKSQRTEREIFINELGTKKTEALNALSDSFENFLLVNYPKQLTLGGRTREFLTDIQNNRPLEEFNQLNLKAVLEQLENSGLRKDIYIYGSEIESYTNDYQIEQYLPKNEVTQIDISEINENFEEMTETIELSDEQILANDEMEKRNIEYAKRRPNTNTKGLFLYALAKSMQADTAYLKYVDFKTTGLDIIPPILATNYLTHMSDEEMEKWHNRLPLIIDIYYFNLLQRQIEIGKK